MAKDNEVKVGDRVKDRLTGFAGIAFGITEYLAGCRRIHIQPEKLKTDGTVHEYATFDEPMVEVIKARAMLVKEETSKTKKDGGPSYLNPAKPTMRHK
jgi:hypothetical protein